MGHAPLVYTPTVVTATGDSVPVAIGGYKAVAGEGGAVHEVPGLYPAPALVKQEAEGGVSFSTGTSAVVSIGKREAAADPSLILGYHGYPTGGPVPVAIGGYKAVAGEGGAVHEVPGLLPAPALVKQESEGGVSLSTGTSAVVHVVGKRVAEAE